MIIPVISGSRCTLNFSILFSVLKKTKNLISCLIEVVLTNSLWFYFQNHLGTSFHELRWTSVRNLEVVTFVWHWPLGKVSSLWRWTSVRNIEVVTFVWPWPLGEVSSLWTVQSSLNHLFLHHQKGFHWIP